ncbi:MAG: cell division protein FtsZ [Alphaproteobacteria bacterium]
MTINLSIPHNEPALKPRITVIGVGGAGGNAVNNMIASNLEGVDFIVANTDAQALARSLSSRVLQLGLATTQGLGAGARPEIGRAAAEEIYDQVVVELQGSHMVFMAAGMGGGTGTGAAPVIARAAREQGILTVGVVTKPFHFEGQNRMRIAEEGIRELQQYVDTLIVIPNQNLFRIANQHTTFADAFKMADNVLMSGVRGVTDLMVMPGLVNLDFADVRSVMSEMGKAMMGTGEAEGEKRAIQAAEAAISNPLLDDVSMKGARGVLINITGGLDMTLFEVDEAANRIRDEVDPDANIIFGSTFDEKLEGRMRVSVIATGIDAAAQAKPVPSRFTVVGGSEIRRPAASAAQPAPAVQMAQAVQSVRPATIAQAAPMAQSVAAEAKAQPAPAQMPEVAETLEMPLLLKEEAAPPAAERPVSGDAARLELPFIPPRPAEPARTAATTATADPFAEAAIANGGGEMGRRPGNPTAGSGRGLSFFERMTGGRARQRRAQEEAAIQTQSALGQPTANPAPAPKAQQPAARPAAETPVQPRLGGLDAKERINLKSGEDDLLDIPAFLRRQAN